MVLLGIYFCLSELILVLATLPSGEIVVQVESISPAKDMTDIFSIFDNNLVCPYNCLGLQKRNKLL